MKRLTKSTSDRRVSGVCGGIANYLNIDSTFVRLVFLLLLFTSIGIPVYIVLSIIMPYDYEERRQQSNYRHTDNQRPQTTRKDVTPHEDDWSDF
ncbi:MAG: PspC domain-containing protein [Aerococcaceae bacterium]|nr:PspC domain-containing protein [Aerococcaceae bacterium]